MQGSTYSTGTVFANNTIANNYCYIMPALYFCSSQAKMVNNIYGVMVLLRFMVTRFIVILPTRQI